ncbi:MAG TPA: ferritin-like domain-containing protein [Solirubrobacteraceae bacterium]|nr:ferritin-like domain-containing protein [Solirubrobacteraceae bacterium]
MAASTPAAAAEATRREMIAGALAVGRTHGDRSAVRAMVRAEQVLVATYEQLLAAGAFTHTAERVAHEFLGHERAHVAALRAELGRASAPRSPRGLGSVATLDTRQAVELLVGVERAALSVYYTELARIRAPSLAKTAAVIMANEAQHASVLLELVAPGDVGRAVPAAFVDGTR